MLKKVFKDSMNSPITLIKIVGISAFLTVDGIRTAEQSAGIYIVGIS